MQLEQQIAAYGPKQYQFEKKKHPMRSLPRLGVFISEDANNVQHACVRLSGGYKIKWGILRSNSSLATLKKNSSGVYVSVKSIWASPPNAICKLFTW